MMVPEATHVLCIEDNETDALLLREGLAESESYRFELTHCRRLNEALERMGEQSYDAILLDLGLPDSQGLSTLERVKEAAPQIPVVVLTGLDDEPICMQAINKGAQDYLIKGQFNSTLLVRTIRYAIERHRLLNELNQHVQKLDEWNRSLEDKIRERTQSLVLYQQQLQIMASKLTLTEQNERRRLATELHDYLAQMLVITKMKLGQIRHAIELDPLQGKLADIDGLLDQSLKYTRTLIAELSPTILYELGLIPAVQWLGKQMENHGLKVSVRHSMEQLPLPEDQAVLLFQIIRELLMNVIKHAQSGEAEVRFQQETSDQFQVLVSDRGIGFDKSRLGSDPTRLGRYGLFSIRERIETIGGMLEIESRPSQGTTVKLTIPLPLQEALRERRGQTHDGHPSAPNPADAYRETSGVINVLLADDHDMVRKGFCAIIESDHNYRIVGEAIDGCSAVELTRSLQPNVVLMDVNMPRMNGIEATRIIKQEKPETIVIALSVNNDQHIVTSMMEAGASAYLTKGGSLDELFRVMNSVLPRV